MLSRTHCSPLLHRGDQAEPAPKTALIILNSPLGESLSPLFQRLWELSHVHICADGGANRLYEVTTDCIPHVITGDLDSLKPHVKEFYIGKGVSIRKRPDQNHNDFDKALTVAVEDMGCVRCLVYGAFGGRFDQEMASMQALYKWSDPQLMPGNVNAKEPCSIWLYDDHTCAFLLPADTENRIELALGNGDASNHFVGEGPTCGLIPLGSPCQSLTTTGFQWNLDNASTEFGGLVSTSNRIVGDQVTVKASSALIFTAEVHCGRSNSWTSASSHAENSE